MSKTDLEKLIVLACQDAWRQEGNTTLNKMIEWILRVVLVQMQEDFDKKLEELFTQEDTFIEYTAPEPAQAPIKKLGRPKNG